MAANRFVVVDVLASANSLQNDSFFTQTIGRNEQRNRLANDLLGLIAENSLGAEIPRLNDSVEIFCDDGVV